MKQKTNNGKLMGIIFIVVLAITMLLSSCSNSIAKTVLNTTSSGNSTTTKTATTGTSLSISVDKPNVNTGDSFTINVIINSQVASRGVQCALSFDPSAMQCNGVTQGNFYTDWASANNVTTAVMPASPAIDNTQGIVATWAVAVMGQISGSEYSNASPGGAIGQGVVFSYSMTAKTGINKKISLQLSAVKVMDENADPINNVGVKDGTVTIGTP